jgi:hypothetical protein
MSTYLKPSPTKLESMSMEELNRLARNQGEDRALRHQALELLNRRERSFFSQHAPIGRNPMNYAEGL